MSYPIAQQCQHIATVLPVYCDVYSTGFEKSCISICTIRYVNFSLNLYKRWKVAKVNFLGCG